VGLIARSTEGRIEQDFRRLIPSDVGLFTSRVPSGDAVTAESLRAMSDHLTRAASLLPSTQYAAIGYGCTSGTAHIGAPAVADMVHSGARTQAVCDPMSALVAASRVLNLRRMAFLSPYVASVSDHLRARLAESGIDTPVFGSFEEAEETRVARIPPKDIARAARDLAQRGAVEAVFLSCTNLDTLDIIAKLTRDLGIPVLSSNQVLVWHMCHVAGISPQRLPALVEVGLHLPDATVQG